MKLGIFGGTFDPVHIGHLILAEAVREACVLDEVRFLPAYSPPHKQSREISPGKQRVDMLEFATAGFPEFVVDQRELKRQGTSYTVDTLAELKQEFPDAELHFLMGADSLIDLPTWREPQRIAELAKIIAVNRNNSSREDLEQVVKQLPVAVQAAITIVDIPEIAVSASDLRSRISENRSIRFLTPRPVERYIQEQSLYQSS
ncbi:MAG: nicotinate-nucleotide adenylyltransferase [Planctomycetaceae bacterium]|nr:nicotinate-nucleotide adenylyltransferase [Planctomycetaceae bacterium]